MLTIYENDALLLQRGRRARSLAHPLLRRATVVTVLSREIGNRVQAAAGRLVEPRRVHHMPSDTRAYPWTRGGGGAVVISPLVTSQRVDLALETVAALASRGHPLPLIVVGDGPERAALAQRASALGISAQVRFVGAKTGPEVRTYLERADVLLFTAQGDAVARAAIEALTCGVPVVAGWDSGAAVPESGPGRLSLPAAESLAQAVMESQADPDRLVMGRLVGESWRARLAPDHVAELCEGWYRNALNG